MGAHRFAALVIGIADRGSQGLAVHGGIVRQRAKPTGIEPAVAGLHFLGGHQVFGEVPEHRRHIHRGHQAGIKAHQLQGRVFRIGGPDSVKGLIHFGQIQGIQAVELIKGRAAHRAAAMVPEGDRYLVGGIVGVGEVQEFI